VCIVVQVCGRTQVPRVDKLNRDTGQCSSIEETSQVLVDRAVPGECQSHIYFKL
jgi:hypothetical protein